MSNKPVDIISTYAQNNRIETPTTNFDVESLPTGD